MTYSLIKDLISLVELYHQQSTSNSNEVKHFMTWLQDHLNKEEEAALTAPNWIGKNNGRSADSVINTSLVHLYRYAKQHAKEAITGTGFSTPDDLFYLISLMASGSMTKTALIKHNVHEKSVGIQIINRLIAHGYVLQSTAEADKRNRMIHLTEKGKLMIHNHLQQMREASQKVTEPLTHAEKMQLIKIMTKLEDFHENNDKR